MNWSLAILQAVIIAAISAVISYFVSKRQSKLAFTYDYRKYILERRKKPYEKIEAIIKVFHTHLTDTQKLANWITGKNKEDFIRVTIGLIEAALQDLIWLSPRMTNQILRLEGLLTELEKTYPLNIVLEESKAKAHNDINKYFKINFEMIDIFFEDMTTLDDVDHFKATRNAEHKALLKGEFKF